MTRPKPKPGKSLRERIRGYLAQFPAGRAMKLTEIATSIGASLPITRNELTDMEADGIVRSAENANGRVTGWWLA